MILSIHLGINYICRWNFCLFTTGSRLEGTVTDPRLLSCDCGKCKNEPSTSNAFPPRAFLTRERRKIMLDILTLNSLSIRLSASLRPFVFLSHTGAHFGSLKFPPLKPCIILVNPSHTSSVGCKMELNRSVRWLSSLLLCHSFHTLWKSRISFPL